MFYVIILDTKPYQLQSLVLDANEYVLLHQSSQRIPKAESRSSNIKQVFDATTNYIQCDGSPEYDMKMVNSE